VEMLNDLAVFDAEDVDDGATGIVRRLLRMDMQGDQIAVCDHAVDGGARLRVVAEEAFKVGVEWLGAVRHEGIVLDVTVADVEPRRLGRAMLVEGQIIEGDDDPGVFGFSRGARGGRLCRSRGRLTGAGR